jgi:hypothetical protein
MKLFVSDDIVVLLWIYIYTKHTYSLEDACDTTSIREGGEVNGGGGGQARHLVISVFSGMIGADARQKYLLFLPAEPSPTFLTIMRKVY